MPASRKLSREEVYGVIPSNAPPAPPDPETDINVKRGLTWAIGGTVLGAVVGVSWLIYGLFAPGDGTNEAAAGITEFIVIPVLALLYGSIGALVGGCIGMAVGLVFIGIAAVKEARESEEEEDEQPLVPAAVGRTMRGNY